MKASNSNAYLVMANLEKNWKQETWGWSWDIRTLGIRLQAKWVGDELCFYYLHGRKALRMTESFDELMEWVAEREEAVAE